MIYARNCVVKEISNGIASKFLNRNHIHIYYRREQNDVVDEVVNQLYTAYNCNIDTRWSSEKNILFGKRLVQEIKEDDLSRD